MGDGVDSGYGVERLRKIYLASQPLLSVFGHHHGTGTLDRIGESIVLNPGSFCAGVNSIGGSYAVVKPLDTGVEQIVLENAMTGKARKTVFSPRIDALLRREAKKYEGATLFTQIRKRARQGSLTEYSELLNGNIDSLRREWERRERYFERGELQRLREGFRRYGFVFYRFANYPEADAFTHVGQNLRLLGEKLRNLSSVQKYFSYVLGMKPLTEIEPRFSECAELMDAINGEIAH
jgi:hypothetical protein